MNHDKLRNIGIIAHVDAGKTTVTERLLYYTGRNHKAGDTHRGNTTTDSTAEERKHGVTIYSAATSMYWNHHKITVIDTPGHIDFNIEVKRALRVLDGAVVVFDAVAGVEPQTETNWHLADSYSVPRLAFVNKMDREGADFAAVLAAMEQRLGARTLAIQWPVFEQRRFCGMLDPVAMCAWHWPHDNLDGPYTRREPRPDEWEHLQQMRQTLLENVAEFDERLLRAYLDDEDIDDSRLRIAIRRATIQGRFIAVLCGSAYKNKGMQLLLDAIVDYLPSPRERPAVNDHKAVTGYDGFAALAFKVVNHKHGSLTYVRVYKGGATKGDVVFNAGRRERISGIYEMHADDKTEQAGCRAGDIVAFGGLKHTGTGDTLYSGEPLRLENISAPEPVIDVAVEAQNRQEMERMLKTLRDMTRQDPSIRLKQSTDGQTLLSAMGELQLQIIREKLQDEHSLVMRMGRPQVAYRETLAVETEVRHLHRKQTGGPGQFADVRMRLSPMQRDSGIVFENRISGGRIPAEYIPGVEAGIRSAAQQGVLLGYPCVDIKVVLIDGDFHSNDSSLRAFETAAYDGFHKACRQGGMVLLEPVMAVQVRTPVAHLGDVLGDVARRRGTVENQQAGPGETLAIRAMVPLAEMFGYIGDLRALSSGRGQFTMEPHHYATVPAHLVAAIKTS